MAEELLSPPVRPSRRPKTDAAKKPAKKPWYDKTNLSRFFRSLNVVLIEIAFTVALLDKLVRIFHGH
jgi:hypothetical protein